MCIRDSMGSVFVRADGAVVYTQAAAPTVDEANKIIYGNGTPLLLKQAVPKAMW